MIIFTLLMNFLTFGISFYVSIKLIKIYDSLDLALFIHYQLIVYDLMFRHDIGEIGAFVFLPIAVLGIYEIFYGERNIGLH